jgi:hypothetical protein
MHWFTFVFICVGFQLVTGTGNGLLQSVFSLNWLQPTTVDVEARQQIETLPKRNVGKRLRMMRIIWNLPQNFSKLQFAVCAGCQMAITALIAQRRLGFGVGYLSAQSSFLCSLLRIKNFPPEVCRGLNNAVTVSGIDFEKLNFSHTSHVLAYLSAYTGQTPSLDGHKVLWDGFADNELLDWRQVLRFLRQNRQDQRKAHKGEEVEV